MDGLAEDESCRFPRPKSVQEEDSLLVQSKPKSTQYKDKWAVEVGINRKTAHSLRIACATKLFNSGVEEKLIRERAGDRSNAC